MTHPRKDGDRDIRPFSFAPSLVRYLTRRGSPVRSIFAIGSVTDASAFGLSGSLKVASAPATQNETTNYSPKPIPIRLSQRIITNHLSKLRAALWPGGFETACFGSSIWFAPTGGQGMQPISLQSSEDTRQEGCYFGMRLMIGFVSGDGD